MNAFFRMIGRLAFKLLGRKPRGSDEPTDSVVVLFRAPPSITDDEIVAAIGRVFASTPPRMLPEGEQPPPEYAPDAPPCRMIPFAANRGVYGLMIGSFPYIITHLDESHPAMTDPSVMALVDHRGWISIDFVTGKKPDDPYSILGQIAAEFIDDYTTLVFVPSLMLVAPPSADLSEAMRSGQWFEQLEILKTAIMEERPAGDPKLTAAARQARDTFPEFVEAFENNAGTEFSAKFSFTDGDRIEHMWVAIDGINGQSILGTLGNSPGVVTNIREGDMVTRTLDELEDWLYMNEGQMVGGFSVRAILAEGDESQS